MSTLNIIKSFPANGALEAGLFVKLSSGRLVACGAGEDSIGISVTSAASQDDIVDVCIAGEADLQVAAALARGVEVTPDANGRAVAVTSTDSRGALVVKAGAAPSGSNYPFAKVITQPIKPVAA